MRVSPLPKIGIWFAVVTVLFIWTQTSFKSEAACVVILFEIWILPFKIEGAPKPVTAPSPVPISPVKFETPTFDIAPVGVYREQSFQLI